MPRIIVACTEPEARAVGAVAVSAYQEARSRDWPFLSDVLERAARQVDENERGTLTAVVHALCKYDRLLEFVTGTQSPVDRFEALLALVRGETGTIDARIARIESSTERLGVAFSFPDWLVERLRAELGEPRLEATLGWMNETAPRVARVNTLKTSREECLGALGGEGIVARATTCALAGLVIEGRRSPFRTQAFARGEIEIQDEASQLVAELVAPPPRSLVVDACAGAGGKTLALAALLGGKGRVVALDASESKLFELRRRARRAGATDVRAVRVDLLQPGEALRELEGRAARVLLDAPCSGLGAIRRNPEVRWRLRPADLSRLTASQEALTAAAAALVAPRGRLIFATCSFLPSEGERIVEPFLEKHPGFSRVTVRDVLGRARSEPFTTPGGVYLRTAGLGDAEAGKGGTGGEGNKGDMDGFFAAVVRRTLAPA
jgi:16S rRNA C967 or C1407 C5-methylase (RsmB/RsmF family)